MNLKDPGESAGTGGLNSGTGASEYETGERGPSLIKRCMP